MTQSLYPAWTEELRRKYVGGEASVFILHGNVFDRFWVNDVCMDVPTFLAHQVLAKDGRDVLELSLSSGLTLLSGAGKKADLPNNIPDAVVYLNKLLVDPNAHKTAVVVPYASTLLPQTDMSLLSVDERILATALHKWSLDQQVEKSDHLIVLVTEFLTELNSSLVSNPRVAVIEIPLPHQDERALTIAKAAPEMSQLQQDQLAHHTAGLRGIQRRA